MSNDIKPVKVRAVAPGFYGNVYRAPGDVFEFTPLVVPATESTPETLQPVPAWCVTVVEG